MARQLPHIKHVGGEKIMTQWRERMKKKSPAKKAYQQRK